MSFQSSVYKLSDDFTMANGAFSMINRSAYSHTQSSTRRSSAVCGCNPDSGFSGVVSNLETPLSLHSFNVGVSDCHCSEWVDNSKELTVEFQLWAHPNYVCSKTQENGYKSTDGKVLNSCWVKNTLKNENQQQKKTKASPSKIGLRSEDFIFAHTSIFASAATNRVGI